MSVVPLHKEQRPALAELDDIGSDAAVRLDSAREHFRLHVERKEVADSECIRDIGPRSVNIHPLAARLPFEPDMARNVSAKVAVCSCHDDSPLPGTQLGEFNTVAEMLQYGLNPIRTFTEAELVASISGKQIAKLGKLLEREINRDEVRTAIRNAEADEIVAFDAQNVNLDGRSDKRAIHSATPNVEAAIVLRGILTELVREVTAHSVEIRRAS